MDPRRLLPALVATALVSVLMSAWVVLRPGRAPDPSAVGAGPAGATPAVAVATSPREVLRAWDERRAAAWASGDVGSLRGLYVTGSRSGRRDVEMLGEYAHRGLVVDGLRTQVLALVVLDRTPRRLRLRVTDRVAGGVVRDGSGRQVSTLPVDQASTRVLTLRQVDGAWRVAEVRDTAPSAE